MSVNETCAIEIAEYSRELLEKDTLEVGVFLVGPNNVWSRGEGVLIAVLGVGIGRIGVSKIVDVVRWIPHGFRLLSPAID